MEKSPGSFDQPNEPWLESNKADNNVSPESGQSDLDILRTSLYEKIEQHLEALPDEPSRIAFLESMEDTFDSFVRPESKDDEQ